MASRSPKMASRCAKLPQVGAKSTWPSKAFFWTFWSSSWVQQSRKFQTHKKIWKSSKFASRLSEKTILHVLKIKKLFTTFLRAHDSFILLSNTFPRTHRSLNIPFVKYHPRAHDSFSLRFVRANTKPIQKKKNFVTHKHCKILPKRAYVRILSFCVQVRRNYSNANLFYTHHT